MKGDDFYSSLYQGKKKEDKKAQVHSDFPESHEEAITHLNGLSQTAEDEYKGRWERKYVLYCSDRDHSLRDLLKYIQKIADYGHSFGIVVDKGNSDYEKSFSIDGDGSDHIFAIEEFKKEESTPPEK